MYLVCVLLGWVVEPGNGGSKFFLISGVSLTTWRSSLKIIYSLNLIISIPVFPHKVYIFMLFLTSVLWKLSPRAGLVAVEDRKVSFRLSIIEIQFFICSVLTPVTTSNTQPKLLIYKIVNTKNIKSIRHSVEIPFQYFPVGTEKTK